MNWIRGRRGIVVAIAAIGIGLFTVLIPFVVKASALARRRSELSLDPTANVLLGWSKNQSAALVLDPRDDEPAHRRARQRHPRLDNLQARVSHRRAGHQVVGRVRCPSLLAVVLPLAVQSVVSTIAYGGVPDLLTIARVGLLYLTVPTYSG